MHNAQHKLSVGLYCSVLEASTIRRSTTHDVAACHSVTQRDMRQYLQHIITTQQFFRKF